MWVAEHKFEVLGTRFSVRSDSEEPAVWTEGLLAPFASTDDRPVKPRNRFSLAAHRGKPPQPEAFLDCRRIARSPSWAVVLDQLVGALNRRAIDAMPYFGVHAGVVSTGSETLAFPAASGAGKSTLVAACVQNGFGYVSDEALCVDYESKAVIPYPKPVSLSNWSFQALAIQEGPWGRPTAEAKGPAQLHHGMVLDSIPPLASVILFERRPGPPRLEPRKASEVMAGLLAMSFNHYKRPADAFRLTAELARICQGFQLTYNHPASAAELLGSRVQ